MIETRRRRHGTTRPGALGVLLAFLFPDACLGCGRPLAPEEDALCPRCDAALRATPGTLDGPGGEAGPLPIAYAVRFEGTARALIHALKYEGRTRLARRLAALAAPALPAPAEGRFDALVPIPLHRARRRERGFNQSELLARELGGIVDLPVTRCLVRGRGGRPQAALSRAERLVGVRGAFAVRGDLAGLRLLLVDDVATTGATLSEARDVLARAGAREIAAFALAGTPDAAGPGDGRRVRGKSR